MRFLEKLKKTIGIEEDKKIEEKKEKEEEGKLAIDVYQTEDSIFIEAPIAGVKPDEIEVFFEGDVLTIQGERKKIEEEERDYLIKECFWGKFSRKIVLPKEINFEQAQATLKDGILKIKIPKLRKVERKRIYIQ